MVIFPGMVIVKVAMTHLWSLPMWIVSLASASLMDLKYLLLVNMMSICFFRYLLEIGKSFDSEVSFSTSCVTQANVSSNHLSPSSALKSPPTMGMYLLQFAVRL